MRLAQANAKGPCNHMLHIDLAGDPSYGLINDGLIRSEDNGAGVAAIRS
jgi:hypothetical protein